MFRCRMLRHGGHQVKSPSLSGSKARAEIHQAAAENALDERALLRKLADRPRFPLFRVHVHVGARDVHVAAEHERAARGLKRRAYASSASRNRILAGKSLPPFGTYTDATVRSPTSTAAMRFSKLKAGWVNVGRSGAIVLAHVQADARVALAAVPIAPVALHLAEGRGDLIGRGLDFLQADDVRALRARSSRGPARDAPGCR